MLATADTYQEQGFFRRDLAKSKLQNLLVKGEWLSYVTHFVISSTRKTE